MADPIRFTFREIAEALVKQKDIHEGIWGIYVEFGIGATNISQDGTGEKLNPGAIVPIVSLGIQPFGELNSLTVDAAKVNPIKEKTG